MAAWPGWVRKAAFVSGSFLCVSLGGGCVGFVRVFLYKAEVSYDPFFLLSLG